jgi:hypothetical protein
MGDRVITQTPGGAVSFGDQITTNRTSPKGGKRRSRFGVRYFGKKIDVSKNYDFEYVDVYFIICTPSVPKKMSQLCLDSHVSTVFQESCYLTRCKIVILHPSCIFVTVHNFCITLILIYFKSREEHNKKYKWRKKLFTWHTKYDIKYVFSWFYTVMTHTLCFYVNFFEYECNY